MTGIRMPEAEPPTEYFAALDRTAPQESHVEHYDSFCYESTRVRVFTINGQRWAVGADVCAVLELVAVGRAMSRLDDDDKLVISRSDTVLDTQGIWNGFAPQVQTVTLISENGATDLVLDSRKPDARKFRRWLTHTVWPSIRETGSYSAAPALQGPELMAAGYVEAMKTLEAREARIHQLETQAAVDAPKVSYVDTYVADSDLLSFSTVASTNGVLESALRDLLMAKDWIYRQEETRWSNTHGRKEIRYRYTEKSDKKRYFRRVEVHKAPRFRGEVMHTLKITPVGAEAIARLIAKENAA